MPAFISQQCLILIMIIIEQMMKQRLLFIIGKVAKLLECVSLKMSDARTFTGTRGTKMT